MSIEDEETKAAEMAKIKAEAELKAAAEAAKIKEAKEEAARLKKEAEEQANIQKLAEEQALKEAKEEAARLKKENAELKALQAEEEKELKKAKSKKFKLVDRPDGVSFHDYVMSDPNLPEVVWVKTKDVEFIYHQARSAYASANPYFLRKQSFIAVTIKEDIAYFVLKSLQGGNSKLIVRTIKPKEVVAAEKIQAQHDKKVRQAKIKEININM